MRQVYNYPVEGLGPGNFFESEQASVKFSNLIVLACGHGQGNMVEPFSF
jgi:hypothetical protein